MNPSNFRGRGRSESTAEPQQPKSFFPNSSSPDGSDESGALHNTSSGDETAGSSQGASSKTGSDSATDNGPSSTDSQKSGGSIAAKKKEAPASLGLNSAEKSSRFGLKQGGGPKKNSAGGKGDSLKQAEEGLKFAKGAAGSVAGNPIAMAKLAKQLKDNPRAVKLTLAFGALGLAAFALMFMFIANLVMTQISAVAQQAEDIVSVDTAKKVTKYIATKLCDVNPGCAGVRELLDDDEVSTSSPTPKKSSSGAVLAQQEGVDNVEVKTEITTLLDQLDFSKSLEMLNQKDEMKYYNGDKRVKYEDLKNMPRDAKLTVQIGSRKVDLSKSQPPEKIVDTLSVAIRERQLFGHDSRLMYSPGVKQIMKDAGINLERWEGNGSQVTDYGKNIKSAYDSVSKGTERVATRLKDLDETGEALNPKAVEVLEANPSSGEKNYPKKVSDEAWKEKTGEAGRGSIEAFAKEYQDSPALFTVASYCGATSYVEKFNIIAKQQFIGAQRNGVKMLSAPDQSKQGEVRQQTMGAEAQRHEGFEYSRSYKKAIGLDVRNTEPDLNESQLAYQNPKVVKRAMQDVIEVLEKTLEDDGVLNTMIAILGGSPRAAVVNSLQRIKLIVSSLGGQGLGAEVTASVREATVGILCTGISTEEGRLSLRAGDELSRPAATTGARIHGADPESAGEEGATLITKTVQQSLKRHGAKKFAKQLESEGTGRYTKPSVAMIDFMINSQQALDYAGLDSGVNLLSKEFQGTDAFFNDVARKNGARPLTTAECAIKKGLVKRENAVIRNAKPLYARLFNVEEPLSPVSLAIAHAPLSKQGAIDKTRYAMEKAVNPLSGIATSTQKLAYSLQLADNPAFAATDNIEDNELCYGFSDEENKKMDSDESFWPIPNSVIVEANLPDLEARYKDCIDKPMYELVIADAQDGNSLSAYDGKCDAENLSSVDALRYRSYRGSKEQLTSLIDMQTITEDARIDPVSPGAAPEGEITEAQTVIIKNCGGDARTFQGIAQQVEAMCTAAKQGGVDLSIGNSWRPTSEQISLRRSNCGSSQYAIYEAPARNCSPPTARPGKSNHQRGVAIDFSNCDSTGSACHQWLLKNAAQFGLKNLPGEPWHWSIDGK